MKKYTILVFFGGASSEYGVSLQSAYSVIQAVDRSQYEPVLIGITEEGRWLHFTGSIEKIKEDRWQNDEDCTEVLLRPGERSIWLQQGDRLRRIEADAAFPVLHGKNGEDGSIQGLLQMMGIPVIGCGVLASALCMDKYRAHQLVSLGGISVPRARVFQRKESEADAALAWADQIGYPIYVKPVKAGSSYGITKALNQEQLIRGMEKAFVYDDEVMIEENIEGFEVGCAVLGSGNALVMGEIDEIELSKKEGSDDFFDYAEKYTLETARIHVPARIEAEMKEQVKKTAKEIYERLGCAGFARVDMFITPQKEIVFNEVNTIPGFTEHSRYPNMMRAAGMSFQKMVDRVLQQEVNR
ncbi:MAG: D-alanine--D-serine ligase VanG [Lachnospiraceae bacterium]|jgi:D-alanine---D-serine ligase|nr:D-alanine--D-serine ligase VanG [Lachnospiraceae bacterium]